MLLKTDLHDVISCAEKSIGVWEQDGQRLAYLASQVPQNGIIVEIGSHRGRSAAYMAAAVKDGVAIYCIDVWNNPNNQEYISNSGDMSALTQFLTGLNLIDKVITLRGESSQFAKIFNEPVDLLFIDGNHKYESVKTDYESWYPHVKRGGVIAFHDYHKNWPGVVRFVDETASKQLKHLGTYWRIWSGQK